ncbi:MAG: hypothetical protein DMG69_03065 [Acidobacteria bacterium]|nr:MAG: hypothetical protein DMG69_03065 [Acidobacteriota bacterium]
MKTMKANKDVTIAICLIAILAFSPVASFAQASTTFSGRAAALRASAVGIALAVSDTGPLPASGGSLKTSVASVNVLGLVSADVLTSATSGSGSSSQSQSSIQSLSLLGGLVTADLVKSNSGASCSNGQASATGNSQLVGLVVAGQPVLAVNPNLAISAPGGISVIVNEQTSSSGGNTGSTTVNALHVTGPSLDIVVASAHSDITCP